MQRNQSLLSPTMFNLNLISGMFNILINIVDPFKIYRKYLFKPILKLLLDAYEEYKSKTEKGLVVTQNAILKLFAAIMIFFLLFCGAILLYVLFYLTYMPTVTQIKPAHMQYNSICDSDAKTCQVGTTISSFHTFPQAHLRLGKKMMVGQPYVLTIKLELPETPRNQEVGMFMLCMDMKDQANILKSHACRSTMLRYRSPWLRKLKTIFLMPFYLMGWEEEKQVLEVEMYNNYIDTTNPVTDIYVEIQSKIVEFYSVTLQISAHFTGLRYILFNFPIISALVGIGINLIALMFMTLLVWYHYNYEMEWIEDTKRKYTEKFSSFYKSDDDEINAQRKDSSSISTTDENE